MNPNDFASDTLLTREQVAFMRKATYLVFWHRADGSFEANAVQELRDQGLHVGEIRRDVPLAASNVTDYAREYTRMGQHVCVDSVNLYRGSVVASVVKLLKAGDQLRVVWVGSNNSDALRTAGLHADELHLDVYRNGKFAFNFLLEYRISPDNSARMVRAA